MEALVARDQLVGEGQTGQQAALTEPEDGAEAGREEEALDDGKGNEAMCEGDVLVLDPLHGPLRLFPNGRKVIDGVEEAVLLLRVLHVRVDQERVRLAVHHLHGVLEGVEGTHLWLGHVLAEALAQVLADDAVRCSEEGQNMRNEVLLVRRQLLEVIHVGLKVDLVGDPVGAGGPLVHVEDVGVLDGKHDVTGLGLGEEGLGVWGSHGWG